MRIYLTVLFSIWGFCLSTVYAGSPDKTGVTSWGGPVSMGILDTQRGGAESISTTVNANFLNAKLFDNTAKDNVTGNNSIMGNAFAGASGIPIVIQNSGNNVIIQNGMVLNLTVQ